MNGPEFERESPELRASLRALAAADRDKAAPPEVEVRLLEAFREQQRPVPAARPRRTVRWAWAAGLAASILLSALWLRREAPPVVVKQVPQVPVAVPPAVAPQTPVAANAAQMRPKARRRPAARPAPPVVQEIAAQPKAPTPAPARGDNEEGQFIPVPYAAGLAPGESLDIVRVRLPRSAMMRFGMPVSAERAWEPVKADLVVGQDGMTRAIRFVK